MNGYANCDCTLRSSENIQTLQHHGKQNPSWDDRSDMGGSNGALRAHQSRQWLNAVYADSKIRIVLILVLRFQAWEHAYLEGLFQNMKTNYYFDW